MIGAITPVGVGGYQRSLDEMSSRVLFEGRVPTQSVGDRGWSRSSLDTRLERVFE